MFKRTAREKMEMELKKIQALQEEIEAKKQKLEKTIFAYRGKWPKLIHQVLAEENLITDTTLGDSVSNSRLETLVEKYKLPPHAPCEATEEEKAIFG